MGHEAIFSHLVLRSCIYSTIALIFGRPRIAANGKSHMPLKIQVLYLLRHIFCRSACISPAWRKVRQFQACFRMSNSLSLNGK
jgi:hypothetical protein